MDLIRSIKISPNADSFSALDFWEWETDEGTMHLNLPKGTKIHVDRDGYPSYIELPDESKVYLHLDDFEKVSP